MREGEHSPAAPVLALRDVPKSFGAVPGRELDALFPKQDGTPDEVVLKVDRLTREGVFTDVSFQVRRGEIVALAGLVGAGRSEVARAIFGVDHWDAGRLDEYRERHRNVWPEMRALRAAGRRNYSLFLREDGLLVGHLETEDFAAARAAMAATEVNARRQAEMAPFFEDLDGRPDESMAALTEVFRLD